MYSLFSLCFLTSVFVAGILIEFKNKNFFLISTNMAAYCLVLFVVLVTIKTVLKIHRKCFQQKNILQHDMIKSLKSKIMRAHSLDLPYLTSCLLCVHDIQHVVSDVHKSVQAVLLVVLLNKMINARHAPLTKITSTPNTIFLRKIF